MERLAVTPASRFEIVLGYMLGLGLFGLIQVAVILFFIVWVIGIHYHGSLALILLIIAIMAVVGVNLDILASAFARTEFQVLQFILLIFFTQVLLGGTFWAVSNLPAYLQPFAYLMPIYYANRALRDVMLKGWGLPEIWSNLVILAGIGIVLVILHNPGHADQEFRCMSITDSVSCRSLIPGMPITDSGRVDRGI